MSNLTKLEFVALDISGNNYLAWTLDAEIHLDAMNLGETIKEGNEASSQDRAKAMIFLRHHLHEGLKIEYLTVKDPYVLWSNLKERYDHQKTVILPSARYNWMHLRLQDFKSVSEYNSAMFKITSQLKLCGESVMEKTYSTFHASNMLLQQQYREQGFKKYFELISCMLVAEQNNELLMKNHQSHPTGSTPFPEANAASVDDFGRGQRHRRGRGRGRGCGRGRGRGRGYGRGYNNQNSSNFKKTTSHHQKWENKEEKQEERGSQNKASKNNEDVCHKCGMRGHWRRTCRTAKHFVDLYQASLKEKGKGVETNLAEHHDPTDFSHLDVADFFENNDGNFENLIADGNINIA
ncbi:uncharacterized protein LOC112093620 [Morus notabilis]|uniref:uncharacterized protein LOC112093620 n=1 Tax=Morus notabilis TaxID=981085 RepID=UPI000CECEE4B|nr:uncharacterized protein LOC112093620 [Morus notabilis]